jgi:hypothetical protein
MLASSDQVDQDPRPTAALRRARRSDADRRRETALRACRIMMATGNLRPAIGDFAKFGVSRKIVAGNFRTIGELHLAALDEDTRVAILRWLMPNGPWPSADDCRRVVDVAVFGRVMP